MLVLDGLLLRLPRGMRLFIGIFVLVLSVGFFTGIGFVEHTKADDPIGLEENYLGNEDNPVAEIMRFKKSDREMLTLVHSHMLSMAMIFLLVGILVWMTALPYVAKLFLTIEPFISVLLTFGGIYWLWKGHLWTKYLVLFSGILMTLTYTISVAAIFYTLTVKPKN